MNSMYAFSANYLFFITKFSYVLNYNMFIKVYIIVLYHDSFKSVVKNLIIVMNNKYTCLTTVCLYQT